MAFFSFLLGLIIGSFLNVVIYRLPRDQSLLWPGSSCPHCEQPLKWWHLVPVFSFFWQRGKCAYCGQPISWQYPLVEVINGLLWWQAYSFYGLSSQALFSALLGSWLLVHTVIDWQQRLLLNKVNLAGAVLAGAHILLNGEPSWTSALIGAFLGGGVLFLIAFLYPAGMGLGDGKMALVMGLWLGWPQVFLALFLASLIGATAGIILGLKKGQIRRMSLPFGPFLAMGTYVVWYWSERLLNWYWQVML
ncbi:MAG: prepilin peptidase [Bacillota bacterium]